MSTGTLAIINGDGQLVLVVAEVNGSGQYTLHSVPEVAGAPVSTGNPMPVVLPAAAAKTPVAGLAFEVVTGGSPVEVFAPNSIANGAVIANPSTATANLLLDFVNTPGTTAPGTFGTTIEIFAGEKFDIPAGLTTPVQVNSTDSAHFFTAYRF